MTKTVSQIFLATLILLMTAAFVITIGLELQEAILSGLAVFLILFGVLLERFYPYRLDWNKNQGDLGGDVTSTVFIFGILDSILKGATPFILLLILTDWTQGSIGIPLWIEIIAVGLLIEFGSYISHRLHHKSKALWSLHAMHHSPKKLHTLNNFRFHPLNHVLNHIATIVPAILLGFSGEAILGYTAIALPILLMQHSNIDFKFGWMNYFLNTNEVHRWHHSNDKKQGNCNLGRALIIWDQLFGPYYFPKEKTSPKEIGLFKSSLSYPSANKFWSQLAYPFSPQCCR